MSSWRSTERHEDFLFWKRSVSPSFLGVFLWCCFGLCLCLGLLCFDFGRHLAFCSSPVLEHVRIADQRQNVLMTVRASSVHGMSSKKNMPSSRFVKLLALSNISPSPTPTFPQVILALGLFFTSNWFKFWLLSSLSSEILSEFDSMSFCFPLCTEFVSSAVACFCKFVAAHAWFLWCDAHLHLPILSLRLCSVKGNKEACDVVEHAIVRAC